MKKRLAKLYYENVKFVSILILKEYIVAYVWTTSLFRSTFYNNQSVPTIINSFVLQLITT